MKVLNASLVALSPELPDNSLTFREKNELEFEVLTDEGNKVSTSFGLTFTLDDEAKHVFLDTFGLDLGAWNGNDSWELPIPGTYVIDRSGRIELAYVDPDYTNRVEPEEILAALRRLS